MKIEIKIQEILKEMSDDDELLDYLKGEPTANNMISAS